MSDDHHRAPHLLLTLSDPFVPPLTLIVDVGEYIRVHAPIQSSVVFMEFRSKLTIYQFDVVLTLLHTLRLVRFIASPLGPMLLWTGPHLGFR